MVVLGLFNPHARTWHAEREIERERERVGEYVPQPETESTTQA